MEGHLNKCYWPLMVFVNINKECHLSKYFTPKKFFYKDHEVIISMGKRKNCMWFIIEKDTYQI